MVDKGSQILLGLGSSLDYEVIWDPRAVSALAGTLGISRWPTAPVRIRDEKDLLSSILAYSASGTGTERAVDSVEIIESVAHKLGFSESLGGTGVRAGRVVNLFGIGCTVHLSSVSPQVERLLWPGAQYVVAGRNTALYPHLIVQFTTDGALTVGSDTRTPPRANRLIFVNDPDSAKLILAPGLSEVSARSSIMLISGLNAITDETRLAERLEQLVHVVHTMGPGSWAIYEDSGFHRQDLAAETLRVMASVCDVVSMNEDEFAGHLSSSVDLDDPESVGRRLLDVITERDIRTLVVHTARWAAAVGAQSTQLKAALVEGVLASSARYLMCDGMTAAHTEQLRSAPMDLHGSIVAAGLERSGVTAVAARSLRPIRPVTVGLGDSFIGGFLAGLHRDGVQTDRPRPARYGPANLV